MKTTASIVLYKTSFPEVEELIKVVLSAREINTLYIVDNSPICQKEDFSFSKKLHYQSFPENIGFGAAHNKAIQMADTEGASFHFIINPDITIEENTIKNMLDFIHSQKEIGAIMPRILYPDRRPQYLPKLLPSPYSLARRKICPKLLSDYANKWYEMRCVPDDIIYEAPVIHGCFSLFRMEALLKVGMYDPGFFMYFEDTDLSRRIHMHYKTVVYPLATVYHQYHREANKSIKMFMYFVKSAIFYFNKWGWIDTKRSCINNHTIRKIKSQ